MNINVFNSIVVVSSIRIFVNDDSIQYDTYSSSSCKDGIEDMLGNFMENVVITSKPIFSKNCM